MHQAVRGHERRLKEEPGPWLHAGQLQSATNEKLCSCAGGPGHRKRETRASGSHWGDQEEEGEEEEEECTWN
eukprot:9062631-Pyramimonas_sp.AAC.1